MGRALGCSLAASLCGGRGAPPHARVIYAIGTAPALGKVPPHWSRLQGTFVDGVLQLSLRRPATVRYGLHSGGTLNATYEWAGGITRARLTRVPD